MPARPARVSAAPAPCQETRRDPDRARTPGPRCSRRRDPEPQPRAAEEELVGRPAARPGRGRSTCCCTRSGPRKRPVRGSAFSFLSTGASAGSSPGRSSAGRTSSSSAGFSGRPPRRLSSRSTGSTVSSATVSVGLSPATGAQVTTRPRETSSSTSTCTRQAASTRTDDPGRTAHPTQPPGPGQQAGQVGQRRVRRLHPEDRQLPAGRNGRRGRRRLRPAGGLDRRGQHLARNQRPPGLGHGQRRPALIGRRGHRHSGASSNACLSSSESSRLVSSSLCWYSVFSVSTTEPTFV